MLAGRYRVLRPLGAGAVGAVYLAEHVHMRKRYAVKILHREVASPEVAWRFRAEAIAAANIGHPGIAAATDFGELPDGSMFLVLEYVAGEPLSTVVGRGPMPVRRALRIARNIFCALGAAHRKGIVHRDVKPANIMLCDDDATVKLLDFGIAHIDRTRFASDERLGVTRLGLIYGSAETMAPEQAAGAAIDARADLYAVGAVLYEMISGRPPFVGSAFEVIAAHISTPSPPLGGPEPRALTIETHELVARLLEKRPEARPADAREAIALVDAAIASLDRPHHVDEPIPPTRRRRRPPSRFTIAVAASVFACIGLLMLGLHKTCGRETVTVMGEQVRRALPPPPPPPPTPAAKLPPTRAAQPPPAAPVKKHRSPSGLRAKLRSIFH